MKKKGHYQVNYSREVQIGALKLGGGLPLVIQSMANTDTNNIPLSVRQCEKIIGAGGQMVRFTTQGLKEVSSLKEIQRQLRANNISTPLVADVHFKAATALAAAKVCDKVRINPGNFTERKRDLAEYDEASFSAGREANSEELRELIDTCRKYNTALRIGVNHGSLSQRIVSRYGDTPEGMVESSLEFLRVCEQAAFRQVVVSLKSSNVRIMVQAVRLLVKKMMDEDLYFPVHLGVTEAGNKVEGRIKSVAGLAPLLLEGIGDTIRVSLTEAPENEIPVAASIKELFPRPESLPYHPFEGLPFDPFHFDRKDTLEIQGVGGKNPPVILGYDMSLSDIQPVVQAFAPGEIDKLAASIMPGQIVLLKAGDVPVQEIKSWFIAYHKYGFMNPVILHREYREADPERFSLLAAGEYSLFLIDSLLQGVWIENKNFENQYIHELSLSILQACRERITSTEYIACPSCGRTLFDIESVLEDIKKATDHLPGLKIAVMGCIVNGPGEMADADYGIIGAGAGLITLYKGQLPVKKNIHIEQAADELIALIRKHGDWKEA